MARPKRLKIKDEEGFFHIMSRTVGQEFYPGDVEKEKLFNIIKYYSGFYFVKPYQVPVACHTGLRAAVPSGNRHGG